MLYIALPVLNEKEHLPRLISCIENQDFRDFRVFVCINQPDEWWNDPLRREICENNLETIAILEKINAFDLTIIDKCSPGKGWTGKKHGVGWARKSVMDEINKAAGNDDIILSLDADTTFNNNYFSSVASNFQKNPSAVALAVPYFHNLVDDPEASRAILRYEIYMRHYSVNLWRIGSPYTFSALGSAMACPVWAYRAVGGMTPKLSGEDFYFLQKLRKYGKMLLWNEEKVYPKARFSDRVYFGTGPAMIKGNAGDWSSYPVYSWRFFDEIEETYQLFPEFYEKTNTTRVTRFLSELLNEEDPFQPLRENFRNVSQFVRACHEKFDGLRVLQYLKSRSKEEPEKDEESLAGFFSKFYPGPELSEIQSCLDSLDFKNTRLDSLERIRMFLVKKEKNYQVNSVLS